MYITVEDDAKQSLEGWKFNNRNGNEEYVHLCSEGINVEDSCGGTATFFLEDIGKLIKCLQLANKHFGYQ